MLRAGYHALFIRLLKEHAFTFLPGFESFTYNKCRLIIFISTAQILHRDAQRRCIILCINVCHDRQVFPLPSSTESPAGGAARIFHCQLGTQRKVVRVGSTASVYATLRHEFRLKSNFVIQRYDAHWCDWIDVNNESTLKDRCR